RSCGWSGWGAMSPNCLVILGSQGGMSPATRPAALLGRHSPAPPLPPPGAYLGQQLPMTAPSRVRSLALYGSTPGLKNSQAPSWIPQIQAKGLRGFLAETIRAPLPGVPEYGPLLSCLDQE